MTTDLVTVAEDDPVELAANLMDWQGTHPSGPRRGRRAPPGRARLVSHDLRLLASGGAIGHLTVGDVMKRIRCACRPTCRRCEALELMRSFGIGALPVVVEG